MQQLIKEISSCLRHTLCCGIFRIRQFEEDHELAKQLSQQAGTWPSGVAPVESTSTLPEKAPSTPSPSSQIPSARKKLVSLPNAAASYGAKKRSRSDITPQLVPRSSSENINGNLRRDTLTTVQSMFLQHEYESNQNPTKDRVRFLSQAVGMTVEQVKEWYRKYELKQAMQRDVEKGLASETEAQAPWKYNSAHSNPSTSPSFSSSSSSSYSRSSAQNSSWSKSSSSQSIPGVKYPTIQRYGHRVMEEKRYSETRRIVVSGLSKNNSRTVEGSPKRKRPRLLKDMNDEKCRVGKRQEGDGEDDDDDDDDKEEDEDDIVVDGRIRTESDACVHVEPASIEEEKLATPVMTMEDEYDDTRSHAPGRMVNVPTTVPLKRRKRLMVERWIERLREFEEEEGDETIVGGSGNGDVYEEKIRDCGDFADAEGDVHRRAASVGGELRHVGKSDKTMKDLVVKQGNRCCGYVLPPRGIAYRALKNSKFVKLVGGEQLNDMKSKYERGKKEERTMSESEDIVELESYPAANIEQFGQYPLHGVAWQALSHSQFFRSLEKASQNYFRRSHHIAVERAPMTKRLMGRGNWKQVASAAEDRNQKGKLKLPASISEYMYRSGIQKPQCRKFSTVKRCIRVQPRLKYVNVCVERLARAWLHSEMNRRGDGGDDTESDSQSCQREDIEGESRHKRNTVAQFGGEVENGGKKKNGEEHHDEDDDDDNGVVGDILFSATEEDFSSDNRADKTQVHSGLPSRRGKGKAGNVEMFSMQERFEAEVVRAGRMDTNCTASDVDEDETDVSISRSPASSSTVSESDSLSLSLTHRSSSLPSVTPSPLSLSDLKFPSPYREPVGDLKTQSTPSTIHALSYYKTSDLSSLNEEQIEKRSNNEFLPMRNMKRNKTGADCILSLSGKTDRRARDTFYHHGQHTGSNLRTSRECGRVGESGTWEFDFSSYIIKAEYMQIPCNSFSASSSHTRKKDDLSRPGTLSSSSSAVPAVAATDDRVGAKPLAHNPNFPRRTGSLIL